jgi:hypothetical protein
MRGLIIALALLIPTAARAQRVYGASHPLPIPETQPAPQPQPSHHPPAPPQTVPPPIVFPLPPLMTPPAGGITSGFPFEPSDPTRPPRDLYRVTGRESFALPRSTPFIGGLYPGVYPMDLAPAPTTPPAYPAPAPARVATGLLRLSVTPADARIFIDSYFVGIASDIEARRALTLEAGPHRIEIRAPDYETQTFDVRILANDAVTYRGALEPLRPVVPPPTRSPATSSAPMYLIPKCYLGNVPPRASRLPPGCDIKQVQILGQR